MIFCPLASNTRLLETESEETGYPELNQSINLLISIKQGTIFTGYAFKISILIGRQRRESNAVPLTIF